jgi:hypothetical protein
MITRPHAWFVIPVVAFLFVGGYLLWQRSSAPSGANPTPVGSAVTDDMIVLYDPAPGARIDSPVRVRGKARGPWYFEASFPVILKDQNGTILAQVPAQAQSEWMTTDWVEFDVTIPFTPPLSGTKGTLILQKDNPSGLPQYDDEREITVYFK